LGSDPEAIMKQFVADGVQLSALPPYLGGTGLNPPGLVLQRHLRPHDAFSFKVEVPADHTVYYRFQASKPTSITGTCSEGKVVCDLPAVSSEWREGTLEERKAACSLTFKFVSTAVCVVHYEVTVQPKNRFRPPPLASPMTSPLPQAPGAPMAWVTKRRMFRDSVRSEDQTPLPGRKGRMSKWGNWHTGYQPRFFLVNNEYLNYFADDETGALLGSYNLKKLQKVELTDSKGGFILNFDGGKHTVWLRAPNTKEAQLWVNCLEERRRWFDDIPTAAESAKKKAAFHEQSRASQSPRPTTSSSYQVVPKGKPQAPKPGTTKKSQLQMALLCIMCVSLGIFLGKLLI